jgi:hypothetical protein
MGASSKIAKVSGGSKTKSGPTAANRPKARPDVVKTGAGKDTRYTDTKTGESYAAPTYGAFSLQGLTSTDPANVLRNRYGTDIRPMRGIEPANRNNRKDRGIASLVAPPTAPGAPGAAPTTEPAPPTSAELAAIGAPTTPMGPVLVEPRTYTEYDLLDELGPVGGYGAAFAVGEQQPPINWMDIFNTYPNFGVR